ncbi:DUF4397 domain-containing protein [Pedobacter aquae]|uniref:DUF4397 domain-containing protein n=1 Tax=Pedobacter aquae TaxID=2605747 RepID=A0A5C0VHG8_9SPHI|nr:DUF4397 domain-containing protein [Pedobacter aquae]QEK50454.1 DUF4397 domain-containing protein [Pedobacter aquae]
MKNRVQIFVILSMLVLGWVSCTDPTEVIPQPTTATRIMLINASPDVGTIDFYLNGEKINASPLAFRDNTTYVNIARSGTFTAEAKLGSRTLFSQTIFLQPGRSHSLFLTGAVADTSLFYVATLDNIDTPALNKAKLRFINLSPNAPAFNVINSDSTVLFNNAAYRTASNFIELDAQTYSLKVLASRDRTLWLNLPTYNFENGRIYTLFVSNLVDTASRTGLRADTIIAQY